MRTQQEEIYEAQRVLPRLKRWNTIAQVQSYVDSLTDSWWWTRFYPRVERVMVLGSNGRASYAEPISQNDPIGVIALTPMQMTKATLAHELAHVFADKYHLSNSHDPWFAREYLVTVYCIMGPDAYGDLYDSFKRHAIEVAEPLTITDRSITL